MSKTYRMFPSLRAKLEGRAIGFRSIAPSKNTVSIYDEMLAALSEVEETLGNITIAACFDGMGGSNVVQTMFTYAEDQRNKQEPTQSGNLWPFPHMEVKNEC